ncbi:MAG: DUF6650 family protein, partial [Christensenella sp.]
YAVIEDVVGISLNNFLINNAEELTWQETESIFLPLLNTIRILNSHNITHKGISPKTIIITEDKQLKLSGVCTSSIRAVTGELPYELFKGYSAPEQYKKCVSVGEWTDVYSISAVLYKVLTGVMPPSFEVRTPEQVITSPIEIVDSIPLNISNAIMRGLDYSCHNRTQYIRDLISDLYSKNNQQYVLQEKRDNQENNEYSFSEQTTTCFRCMVSACNDFLDKIGKVEETGIIYKNQSGDWENSLFSSAMKQFRKTFRENINTLSCAYDLVFHNEIPEQY